ncbi:MAG: hypothetical protein LUG44_01110 [Clostridiales bacterium]|nr:hypothetical protein [Clostridiales bacterium]
MTDESLILVDAIPDIREALEALDTDLTYTVSCQWPRTAPTSTIITITEIGNNQVTGKLVVDSLSYQIDLWGPDAGPIGQRRCALRRIPAHLLRAGVAGGQQLLPQNHALRAQRGQAHYAPD